MRLSVVIPTLNVAGRLHRTITSVAGVAEVIVVDGGSADGTAGVAERLGACVIQTPPGRGVQLAAGIAAARHDWLVLLHADTVLTPGWREAVLQHIERHPDKAGWFRFALDSASRRARRLERLVAWRSRVLALPYGDQGLLIHRALLCAAGGVRPLPLMEDVDLVWRLGRKRLAPLDAIAVTSAERWEREGWTRRSARNLLCLALWFAGVPPRVIARLYA